MLQWRAFELYVQDFLRRMPCSRPPAQTFPGSEGEDRCWHASDDQRAAEDGTWAAMTMRTDRETGTCCWLAVCVCVSFLSFFFSQSIACIVAHFLYLFLFFLPFSLYSSFSPPFSLFFPLLLQLTSAAHVGMKTRNERLKPHVHQTETDQKETGFVMVQRC